MKLHSFWQERGSWLWLTRPLPFYTTLKFFAHTLSFRSFCAVALVLSSAVAAEQGDDRLVGIWTADQGYRTVKWLFRSDGKYQLETKSTDPEFPFGSTDRGEYEIAAESFTTISYGYFREKVPVTYQFEIAGDSLSLANPNSDLPADYELEPGSRADVLAREQASEDLARRWTRHMLFVGDEEITFRPGGYYFVKTTYENVQSPPQFFRGRYEQDGEVVTMTPYSEDPSGARVEVFGTTLTLIGTNGLSGWFTDYEEVPGSAAEVAAKAAEAEAFLSTAEWQAGVWKIEEEKNSVELLLRPDDVYCATNTSRFARRVLRGRFSLQGRGVQFFPFVGQERYALDDADFGMIQKTYAVDYYDGELQLIDLSAVYQSVTLAYPVAGTREIVLEKARQAQQDREREGWHLGIWERNEPAAWMEFTFRPDNRYIAQSGAAAVAREVERGRYVAVPGKMTLAPLAGNGPARGLEVDLYDGDFFLIGDPKQIVITRKVPGSDSTVIQKTVDPLALKGERGSIFGLWTANRPGESVELVFRQDGQFRFKRCTNATTSFDYGLYTVDMANRRMIYDSRFSPVEKPQLDFYGDTMTLYGGLSNSLPRTYVANVGSVDAAIAASLAEDAAEAEVDAQWLARFPIGPRDPNAPPVTGLPDDPKPWHVFEGATVFSGSRFYQRLIPHILFYIGPGGVISTLGVLDIHNFYFMPTGRVFIRFIYRRAGFPYPAIIEDIVEVWGAYEIKPKPIETDILHFYADNVLNVTTDLGEELALTLENGRRVMFWGKEPHLLAEWYLEQKPIPCLLPINSDASLINTGVSLSSEIPPDPIGGPGPNLTIARGTAPGAFSLSGVTDSARKLVLERAPNLNLPIAWQPVRSNSVAAGPFEFVLAAETNSTAFFRLRSE